MLPVLQNEPHIDSSTDDIFHLAKSLITSTKLSVFLTGKAGTGKTTFLKACKDQEFKNTVVLAPTGVAAVNASGSTIHSFFQLPFTPYLPGPAFGNFPSKELDNEPALSGIMLMNDEKKALIKSLDLIIIDEISMVRCDVVDHIDRILRFVRNQPGCPFGGVQMLFIGDLFQLPPVVRDEEWKLLSRYYRGPYFFNSHVVQAHPPVYLELDKVFRQTDARFIELLNAVRNNHLTREQLELIHNRYQPGYIAAKESGFITLTTHNSKADCLNSLALREIGAPEVRFNATVEGEFYERSFPADADLRLKVGAQVMFLRNDFENPRRYYNGKIATVIQIDPDKIAVSCSDSDNLIEVKKETWRNIRYEVGTKNIPVEEQEIGTFTQFPLRLAWAITIHKSQGLSFEKAIVDAGDAFMPGQVYVALSRCTNLENIILNSQINTRSLEPDPRISSYVHSQKKRGNLSTILQEGMRAYHQDLVQDLFNFSNLVHTFNSLKSFTIENTNCLKVQAICRISAFEEMVVNAEQVSKKFAPQLTNLLMALTPIQNNEPLRSRIVAAREHFLSRLSTMYCLVETTQMQTQKPIIAETINHLFMLLHTEIALKIHLLKNIPGDLSLEVMLRNKQSFHKPAFPGNIYVANGKAYTNLSSRQRLLQMLESERDSICQENNIPTYLLAKHQVLENMSIHLSKNPEDLIRVAGMNKEYCMQYGSRFISIMNNHIGTQVSNSNQYPKANQSFGKQSQRKSLSTRQFSLQLFKQGMSIGAIAIKRKLKPRTVETHLLSFVKTGKLRMEQVVGSR